MHTRKTTLYTLTGAVLAASSAAAVAAPGGLYSADELMDADVYLAGTDEQIGEVEDVIFDSSLTIQSFVIETDDVLELGGESYVVAANALRVETVMDDENEDPDYRVTLNATLEELEAYPEYSDSWWNNVRAQAGDVWEQTKTSAQNAWTQIKQTTSELVDGAADATEEAVDSTADTVEDLNDPST